MQVNVEDVASLTKLVKVVVPEDVVAGKLAESFKKLKADVSIKGFRKGKVPQQIIEKNYGEQVRAEVGEKLVQDTYFDAVEKAKLDVVVHPDIRSHNYDDEGTFTYEAEVAIRPEIDLDNYKGVEVDLPILAASDEEIDERLVNLQKDLAPLKPVEDRGVENNDVVVVDFQGYDNGEAMKQVQAENYSLDIGSGRNGKEFEEACLGLKVGEESNREIEFPGDFPNPVLAGKKVDFKIKITDIKERLLADLDDDFAKDVGEEFETLDALREDIAKKIVSEKEKGRNNEFTDKLMMKIIEKNEFEIPDRLVAYEVNEQIKQLEEQLKQQGMTLESAGISYDQLIEDYKESATARVKGDFIIKKVAELEEIKLEDQDIADGFQRVSDQYGMPVDEVKKYFGSRNDLLPFMNELLNEKVLGFLREQAVVTEVEVEEADTGDNE